MRTAALGGKTFDGKEIAICYGGSPLVNAIFKEIKGAGGVDSEGNKFAQIEVLESVGGRGRRAKFEFKPEAKQQKKGKV